MAPLVPTLLVERVMLYSICNKYENTHAHTHRYIDTARADVLWHWSLTAGKTISHRKCVRGRASVCMCVCMCFQIKHFACIFCQAELQSCLSLLASGPEPLCIFACGCIWNFKVKPHDLHLKCSQCKISHCITLKRFCLFLIADLGKCWFICFGYTNCSASHLGCWLLWEEKTQYVTWFVHIITCKASSW